MGLPANFKLPSLEMKLSIVILVNVENWGFIWAWFLIWVVSFCWSLFKPLYVDVCHLSDGFLFLLDVDFIDFVLTILKLGIKLEQSHKPKILYNCSQRCL